MLLSIIDTETTGIESSDVVIELGLILFDVKSMSIISQLSTLLPTSKENSGEFKNRISKSSLNTAQEFSFFTSSIEDLILKIANNSKFVIAHNAAFDKSFLPEIKTPWLCTQNDFRFPRANSQGSLIQLANDYDVPIFGNHRALADCQLISSIFQKHSQEELENLIKFASQPNLLVVAKCSYAQKELAKSLGFKWDRVLPKSWSKVIKEFEFSNLKNDCKSLGFDCEVFFTVE
jgi:DNA polymerase III subunit epsilon